MLIIGEKINGSRKQVNRALLERDAEFIQTLARNQADAGAEVLDVNAGTTPDCEAEDLVWLVQTVQAVVDKQLCLDSPNPEALAAALVACKQTPFINSISGESSRLRRVLPLAAEHGCPVLALALDETGIAKSCEGRMAVVRRLFEATRALNLPDDHMYVDALVTSVATDTAGCLITLQTMRAVLAEFPRAHLTAGLSNVSFGMPARTLINRAFLTLALEAGLDSAIADPMDRGLMETLFATDAVLGRDRHCARYNRAFRSCKIGAKPEGKGTSLAAAASITATS